MTPLEASGIRPLALDVTDDASMSSVVDRILTEEGRIDVLVNNAGYGAYGAFEKTRYVVGANARPAILARRVLSDRAFDAVIRRTFRVPRAL